MIKMHPAYLKVFLAVLFLAGCTQFLDETETTETYSGTDGCVICHTNAARLQALAEEEEHGGAGGG